MSRAHDDESRIQESGKIATMSDRIPYFDEEPEPEPARLRIRFTLRDLLGLIAIGCVLGGLCLWGIWSFDERALILTWGISLAVAARIARLFGKTSAWWPLSASLIATAMALHVLRQDEFINSQWTWSEYAWKVYRVWAVLLTAAAVAGAMVLMFVRALPRLPAAARTAAKTVRSSRRLRWLVIAAAVVGVVSLVAYRIIGATCWSPYRTARWGSSSLPQVLFLPGKQEFLTIDDAGRVTLWDWESARPLDHYRAEAPKSDETLGFDGAVLKGNRLALAVSANDFVTIYRLPEWTVDGTLSCEEMRSHVIGPLFSLNGGDELMVVHRSPADGILHFSFWDDAKQQWIRHESYDDSSAYVYGVSSSGRYCGVADRTYWDQTSLTVIDFETQSVIFEKEHCRGFGPVFFFDQDRMVAYGSSVFTLDGNMLHEFPGVVIDALPGSRRLILLEFGSLLPQTLVKLTEEVPVVRHLQWLGRVRLVITGADLQPQTKSCWFYGYGTSIRAELSPDGRRVIWVDDQGRLLMWNLPTSGHPSG